MSVYPSPSNSHCVYTLVNPAPPHCGCSVKEQVASCAGELRSPCSQRQLFFSVLHVPCSSVPVVVLLCCFTESPVPMLFTDVPMLFHQHALCCFTESACCARHLNALCCFTESACCARHLHAPGKVCAITGRLRMSMDGNNNLFLFYFFFTP